MAGRILNRRELRRQSDAAELTRPDGVEDETDTDEEPEEAVSDDEGATEGSDEEGDEAPPKKVKKAPARPRKPRKPKVPPRMRARWGVYDGSMKQLALFDYKDRAGADTKVAELAGRKNGPFFVQLVKEPMPEEAAVPPAVNNASS
jgi:hypothetical protein